MIYGLRDELCETVVKVESDVKEELDDDHPYQNEIDEELKYLGEKNRIKIIRTRKAYD